MIREFLRYRKNCFSNAGFVRILKRCYDFHVFGVAGTRSILHCSRDEIRIKTFVSAAQVDSVLLPGTAPQGASSEHRNRYVGERDRTFTAGPNEVDHSGSEKTHRMAYEQLTLLKIMQLVMQLTVLNLSHTRQDVP